jgi:hypothetical protein
MPRDGGSMSELTKRPDRYPLPFFLQNSSGRFSFAGKIFFLLCMDLHLLVLNVESKMVVDAHVLIGYPDQLGQ